MSLANPMRFVGKFFTPLPAAMLRRSADFSAAQIFVLFAVLVLIASIPIITNPLPPLEDYANHLARMSVIANVDRDANLSRFYEIDWEIVPNLMMDLTVPYLVRFMNIYTAGQIFLISIFVLIMSGTLALHRSLHGRWSVLPLIAFPLLYNRVFLIGVANYQFGIGLALWGMAAWIGLREKAWPLRFLVAAIFVLVLFFCHLFAVGVYGLGLLAYELWRLWALRGRAWPGGDPGLLRHPLLDFLATGLPFLLLVPLMLRSPILNHLAGFEWQSVGKIDGITFTIEVYSDIVAFALTGVVVAAAIWAARHSLLRLHPVGLFLLGVGTLIYLALPRLLFDTYMADQRLPLALAFMSVACLNLDLRLRMARRSFIALSLILLLVRVIEVDVAWAPLSAKTLEFRDSVKRIERGSTVLVAYADQTGGDEVGDLGLVHAACLAIIERSALVTTAFTVEGKQVMHVRRPYVDQVDTEDGSPPSIEQLIVTALRPDPASTAYWRAWPQRFDYVYLLFTEDGADNPAPDLLTQVYDGGRFQLYRVGKARTARAGSVGRER
ncbi:hypothetical protein SAMN05519104_2883 [Rhizobiales bacterium GAS188]|nr:hypothetical protein SAMN05519104_2883 [Rhizobiales bacterium GAS188]